MLDAERVIDAGSIRSFLSERLSEGKNKMEKNETLDTSGASTTWYYTAYQSHTDPDVKSITRAQFLFAWIFYGVMCLLLGMWLGWNL